MPGTADSIGARNAGSYLHELLLHQYRARWARFSERNRPEHVNTLAVARVLSDYLLDHPTATRGFGTDPSTIKDVVWRALTGRAMSRETLRIIIEAFGIDKTNADALWRLWSEAEPARVVRGSLDPRPTIISNHARYQTVQRQELHYLGPNGQPIRHRTIQAIRALVDGYHTHRYQFDTDAVTVTSVHGGTPGPLIQVDGALWAVVMELPDTLAAGEVASMEYVTEFHNATPLEPVFRYAAHQRVEHLVIRVEFHPQMLPDQVTWCVWDDYQDESTEPREVWPHELDGEHAVSRSIDALASAAVGFTWRFPSAPPAAG